MYTTTKKYECITDTDATSVEEVEIDIDSISVGSDIELDSVFDFEEFSDIELDPPEMGVFELDSDFENVYPLDEVGWTEKGGLTIDVESVSDVLPELAFPSPISDIDPSDMDVFEFDSYVRTIEVESDVKSTKPGSEERLVFTWESHVPILLTKIPDKLGTYEASVVYKNGFSGTAAKKCWVVYTEDRFVLHVLIDSEILVKYPFNVKDGVLGERLPIETISVDPRSKEPIKPIELVKTTVDALVKRFFCGRFPILEHIFTRFMRKVLEESGEKGRRKGRGGKGGKGGKAMGIIMSALVRYEKWILKGFPQLGKTALMGAIATYAVIEGYTTIIAVMNGNGHGTQLENRFRVIHKEISAMIKEKIKDGTIVVGSEYSNIVTDARKFKSSADVTDALSGKIPQIIVTLANPSSLKKLVDGLKKNVVKKYFLCIDECDAVDCGGPTRNVTTRRLAVLKKYAYSIFFVSATVSDNILQEDIENAAVIFLEAPESYRGHGKFVLKDLTKPAKYSGKTTDNIFENDKNMKKYLRNFAKRSPYKAHDGLIPCVSLVHVSKCNTPNQKLCEHIYTKSGKKVTAIFYNGEGVHIYSKKLSGNISMTDGAGKEVTGVFDGMKYVFKIDIASAMEWLKMNGDVEKFPRIIIVAGIMAGRGISFVSIGRDGRPWHPTEMYLLVADSMTQPELLQVSGRLCTTINDGTPLTLYATEKTMEDVINAYHLQEEILARGVKGEHKFVGDNIRGMKMSRTKFPNKRKLTKAVGTMPLVKVDDDSSDGGWSIKKYVYENPLKKRGKKAKVVKVVEKMETIVEEDEISQQYYRINENFTSGSVQEKTFKEAVQYILNTYSSTQHVLRMEISRHLSNVFDGKSTYVINGILSQIATCHGTLTNNNTNGVVAWKDSSNRWYWMVNE